MSNGQYPENSLLSDSACDMFTPGGETDFIRAEHLVATVYEALRASGALPAYTFIELNRRRRARSGGPATGWRANGAQRADQPSLRGGR